MIFPGMDPYLESPQLWPGVHAALIVYIRDQLQPLLRPRYLAAIEERVYLQGPDRDIDPDVRVHHHRPERAPAPRSRLAESDAPDPQSGRRPATSMKPTSPSWTANPAKASAWSR